MKEFLVGIFFAVIVYKAIVKAFHLDEGDENE